MPLPLSHRRGQHAEQRTCDYLTEQGLQMIARNWRCVGGELDIVAFHGEILVFVEVRARRVGALVDALTSITPRKCARWQHAAAQFLQQFFPVTVPVCRFDVVAWQGESLTWLQQVW